MLAYQKGAKRAKVAFKNFTRCGSLSYMQQTLTREALVNEMNFAYSGDASLDQKGDVLCLSDPMVDFTKLSFAQHLPVEWCLSEVGEAFLGYSGALFGGVGGVVGATATGVINVLKDNFLHDNHPWKQKKYENALQELRAGFQALSGYAPSDLALQIESGCLLQGSTLKDKLLVVLKSMVKEGENHRQSYYEMLYKLRLALESNEYNAAISAAMLMDPLDQAALFLLQLCEARYVSVHLYSFCEHLVDGIIALGTEDGVTSDRLQRSDFEAIDRACFSSMGAVRMAVKKGCVRGWLNVGFDPAMQQNVPFVLVDIPFNSFDLRIRSVRFLRMGSPTIEGYISPAQINLEFRNFIQSLAFQGKRHLYVSLQSDFSYGIGSESGRNRAIKDLQKDFMNFSVVVLDQDSDFYKQQGVFSDLTSEAFMQVFRERLLAEEEGFYFPPAWKEDASFLQSLDATFAICAKIAFGANDAPQASDRRNFIEIYYAFLLIFLTRFANADFVNVTCKDAIDRAMKTLSLFLQIVIIAQGHAENTTYRKIHKVLTHAPAFMVKKQAMIDSRRHRLLQALDVLNAPASQAIIERLANDLGIVGDEIHVQRRDGQSFFFEG